MTRPIQTAFRLICTLLVLLVLAWFYWQPGETPGGVPQEMPALRIVCSGSDKVVRCPSECLVADDGQADCRCQDFYYRRGDEPLQFSHTLCR